MTYFVKMIGASDMPLSNEPWSEREINVEVRFPKRPVPKDVGPGDELVYYAVGGYKRVFATVRVEETPKPNDNHTNRVIAERYPYAARVAVRPSTKLAYVSSGPELNEITPGLQSNVRKGVSHFEIGRTEFDRAVSLLQKSKAEEDQKLKSGWRP